MTPDADTPEGADRRRPRWVYGRGREPDVRFSLANERTFLAWVRTSLALLAAGVGLVAVGPPLPAPLRVTITVALLGLGTVGPIAGWVGWARAERAIREDRPLPAGSFPLVLVAGVVLGGVLLVVGLLPR